MKYTGLSIPDHSGKLFLVVVTIYIIIFYDIISREIVDYYLAA